MLGYFRLPEKFNTHPSPVRNMHFEGPKNVNQMRSSFMEKGEVCSSFLQKELNIKYNLENIDHNHSTMTAR